MSNKKRKAGYDDTLRVLAEAKTTTKPNESYQAGVIDALVKVLALEIVSSWMPNADNELSNAETQTLVNRLADTIKRRYQALQWECEVPNE